MLSTTTLSAADRPVPVEVLRPFRLTEGNRTRETKPGETVEVPLYLARELAAQVPPRVGPKGSYKPAPIAKA
jgi:hypothetical protein